jgi:mediator of replication checkpoint protein 1
VNPHDVSWVDLGDASDEEGSIRIKSVDMHGRRQVRSRRNGIDSEVPSFDVSIVRYVHAGRSIKHVTQQDPKYVTMPGTSMARMQHWAKTEGRSRNAGTTGRSVGGAAVTGHGRAKVKTGGGSLRSGSMASAASTDSGGASEQRRPVKTAPSVLAGVAAERSARFG